MWDRPSPEYYIERRRQVKGRHTGAQTSQQNKPGKLSVRSMIVKTPRQGRREWKVDAQTTIRNENGDSLSEQAGKAEMGHRLSQKGH